MTAIDATRTRATQPPWWAYGWWLAVGALVVFGFLAGFTIGIPFLLLGVGLAVAGSAIPATRSLGISALPAGLALPLFYIAWVNKDGPGMICTTTRDGNSCAEQWNPLPWVVAAALLLAVSIVLVVVTRLLTRTRRG